MLKPIHFLPLAIISSCVPNLKAAADSYVEGEVLVTFKPTLAASGAEAVLNRHFLKFAKNFDKLTKHEHRVSGLIRKKTRTTALLISELKMDSSIETVEPNYIRKISTSAPDDTHYSKLWGLENTGQMVNSTASTSGVDIKFLSAWKLSRLTAGDAVVGVVDTGVDMTHPDLAANIWTNPNEIAGNGIDDDGNGYIDDVHGYDFAASTANITDSGYHGTHVAGTIGAVGRNALGVIGAAYKAKVVPMKVSTDGNTMTTSAVLAAYNYAITLKQKGINIVALNASYGGSSFSTTEQTAIAALRDAGVILCAAAGNGGTDGVGDNNDTTPTYPASYALANVISVAALTQTNGLASYSNYGTTSVDLAAPGSNIYSTEPLSYVSKTTSLTVGSTAYPAVEVTYSGTTSPTGLTKSIYACGMGNTSEFPSGVSGNIALIQRGTLTFVQKVTNAMNAGAVGVILYDNTTNALTTETWTLDSTKSWIPTLKVTQASGTAILAQLVTTGTLVNARDTTLAYQFLNGTSMATPHVTAAVAFAALNFPSETMAQRISRILTHVMPVSALSGKSTSGGRLDLLNMIDTDADGLPDWWETEKLGTLAEGATADDDGDGYTNHDEWLANTSPTNKTDHLTFSSAVRSVTGTSNDFILSFPTVADRSYQIDESEDLVNWTTLSTAITGTGSTVNVADSNVLGSVSKRFYRLSVLSE